MAAGAGAATPAQRENFVDTGVPENLHERKSGLCANNLLCSIPALDTYLAQIASPKVISIEICPCWKKLPNPKESDGPPVRTQQATFLEENGQEFGGFEEL